MALGKLGARGGFGSLGAGNNVSPSLLNVATRTGYMAASSNGGLIQSMARTFHFARDKITKLKIGIPNWFYSGNGEGSIGASLTVTASIEYPAGTFTQLTFGGSSSGTIPDATTGYSDFVNVSIPNGSKFYVRIWRNCSAGLMYQGVWNPTNGDAVAWGTTTPDLTLGGTITDVGNTQGPSFPSAIIAASKIISPALIGDSRTNGGGLGTASGTSGDFGIMAPSIGAALPYINTGRGGDSTANYLIAANRPNRTLLVQQWTNRIQLALGINDNLSAAQIAANLSAIAAIYPNKACWAYTISPQTSSTDGFLTVANQSKVKSTSALNDLIRAGLSGMSGYFDVADVTMSSHNSDFFVANTANAYISSPTPPYTADGIHENPLLWAAIKTAGVINPALIV